MTQPQCSHSCFEILVLWFCKIYLSLRERIGLPFFMVSIVTCGAGETGLTLLGKHTSNKRTNSPSDSMNNVTGRYACDCWANGIRNHEDSPVLVPSLGEFVNSKTLLSKKSIFFSMLAIVTSFKWSLFSWSAIYLSCFSCISRKASICVLFVCTEFCATFWHSSIVVSRVCVTFASKAVIFPCNVSVITFSFLRICSFKLYSWLEFVSGKWQSLAASLKKSQTEFKRQLIATDATILKQQIRKQGSMILVYVCLMFYPHCKCKWFSYLRASLHGVLVDFQTGQK